MRNRGNYITMEGVMFKSKRKQLFILLTGFVVMVSVITLTIRPKHYYNGRILSYDELMQWPQDKSLGCTPLAGTLFDSICFDTEQEVQNYLDSLRYE